MSYSSVYINITFVVGTGGWGEGGGVVVVGFSVVVVVVVVLGVVELVVVVLGVVELVVVLGVVLVVVVVVVEVVLGVGTGVVGMIIGADPVVPSIATAITPINAQTPKMMDATIQGRFRICSSTPAPLKLLMGSF